WTAAGRVSASGVASAALTLTGLQPVPSACARTIGRRAGATLCRVDYRSRPASIASLVYKYPMAATQPLDDRVRDALSRPMTVVDISTTGRKSGEERRIEIVLHNIGGRLYISGQPSRKRRGWLSNLEASPNFTLHLK